MKNGIKIMFLLIILTIKTFSQEIISLESLIDSFLKNSSFSKKQEMELNKLEINKKGNTAEKWQKISYKITPEYKRYYESDNIPTSLAYNSSFIEMDDDVYVLGYSKNDELSKYPGNIQSSFSYHDLLYVNIVHDNTESKFERDTRQIGINKSLNDFYYSEQKYKDISLEIDERKTNYQLQSETRGQLSAIIDSYLEINNLDDELEIKKNSLEISMKELEELKQKVKINEALLLDVEYMEFDIEGIKNEIKYLNDTLKNKQNRLLIKCGFSVKNDELNFASISKIELGEFSIDKSELQSKREEIKLKQEEIKLQKRKYQPNIAFDTNYDVEDEIWTVGLVFSGNIFDYKTNLKTENENLEILKLEKNEIEIELGEKRKELQLELNNLKVNLEITDKKMQNMQKRYAISKKIYNKGYLKLLDYLKDKENLQKAEIEFSKNRNKLNAFKTKLKINSEKFK